MWTKRQPPPALHEDDYPATAQRIYDHLVALAAETGAPQFAQCTIRNGVTVLMVAGTAAQLATLEEAMLFLQDTYIATHRHRGD